MGQKAYKSANLLAGNISMAYCEVAADNYGLVTTARVHDFGVAKTELSR